jgi:hypothetical protein
VRESETETERRSDEPCQESIDQLRARARAADSSSSLHERPSSEESSQPNGRQRMIRRRSGEARQANRVNGQVHFLWFSGQQIPQSSRVITPNGLVHGRFRGVVWIEKDFKVFVRQLVSRHSAFIA